MSASEAKSEDVSKAPQTEDDRDDWKANIKELVKAVSSLVPQPEAAESRREFNYESKRFKMLLGLVRPTEERLDTFANVLLSMFIGWKGDHFIMSGQKLYVGPWFSDFADKFILRLQIPEISPPQDVKPGFIRGGQATQIEHCVKKRNVRALDHGNPVNKDSNSWKWRVPFTRVERFEPHYVGGNSEHVNYQVFSRGSSEAINIVAAAGLPWVRYGYGILCLITAPIRDGALDPSWVNLILAQISRWNYCDIPTHGEDPFWGATDGYHFEAVLYFLAVFAGFWPSRNVRSTFSWRSDMARDTFDRWYLQVHFRYFTAAERPGAGGDTEGLLCHRENGQIVSDPLKVSPHYFKERRISVFGLISLSDPIPSDNIPAFYSVLVLGETNFGGLRGYNLKWQAGLEGTIAFQLAVLTSVDVWEKEWNKMLDQIDDCLTFRLSQTLSTDEINKWMFDDDFERSRLYLTILQILRYFDECISTVSNDLGWLDDVFLKRSDFPIFRMKQDELQVLRSNWELVRETQRKAEKSLLDRILHKIDEVKTLQDGLFNASSLREAKASSKMAEESTRMAEESMRMAEESTRMAKESAKMANESSIMGRYVLIFTVVTVLYLPPTFISTVFALEIFKKDTAQTKWEYKVAIVSVSLLTYVASLLAVIAVTWKQWKHKCLQLWNDFKNWTREYKVTIVLVFLLTYVESLLESLPAVIAVTWKQWKHKCLQWWNDFKNRTSVHDSAVSATNVQAGHAPTQPQPRSNAAGSVPEVKDEESGVPKENKGWCPRLHRSGKSGESSGRRDKGKAPDNGSSPAVPMSNE